MSRGVEGMARGGRREIRIPPQLGYGAKGSGSSIPPNSSLIFEVVLLRIKRGGPTALPPPQAAPAAAPAAAPDTPAPAQPVAAPAQPPTTPEPVQVAAAPEDESVTQRAARLSGELGGGIMGGTPLATRSATGQPSVAPQGAIVPSEEQGEGQAVPPAVQGGYPPQGTPGGYPPAQAGYGAPPQFDAYGRPFMPPAGGYYQPNNMPPAAGGGIDGTTKYQIESIERKVDGVAVKIEEILKATTTKEESGGVMARRSSLSPKDENGVLMSIKDAEGISGEMLVLAIERLVEENKAVKSADQDNMYKEHMELLREKSADLKERNDELKEKNGELKEELTALKAATAGAGEASAELAKSQEATARAEAECATMKGRVEDLEAKLQAAEEKAEKAEKAAEEAADEKAAGEETTGA